MVIYGFTGDVECIMLLDAVWLYWASREMRNVSYCEVDDLSCYDAVWSYRASREMCNSELM